MKGATHSLADQLSRYPNKSVKCPDIEDGVSPSIASRSLRLKPSAETCDDPHIMKIADMGNPDEDYSYMKSFIKEKHHITTVDKESDLSQIQGDYQSLSIHPTEEGEIILKNATEVLISRNYCPEL